MFGIDFEISSSEKGMLRQEEKWYYETSVTEQIPFGGAWKLEPTNCQGIDLESSSSRTEKLETLFDSSRSIALMLDMNYE
jgi:hypothetical protein